MLFDFYLCFGSICWLIDCFVRFIWFALVWLVLVAIWIGFLFALVTRCYDVVGA